METLQLAMMFWSVVGFFIACVLMLTPIAVWGTYFQIQKSVAEQRKTNKLLADIKKISEDLNDLVVGQE